MKRLFSGIQPSGTIHIGNYLGAVKGWASLQDEYDAIFSVVDLHAITVPYDPDAMPTRVREMAVTLLACGIDPDKAILFVQSDVPAHTELTWLFNTVTPMGELGRMTQFKDKSKQHEKNVTVGLFDYPVLQTADILLYKGEVVPVGEDQVQHVELARTIARKFNHRFRPLFPLPEALVGETKRVLGLDGQAKMSKSLDNYIGVAEEPDAIWDKLRNAYSDPQRKRKVSHGRPGSAFRILRSTEKAKGGSGTPMAL
jgi:tryptophanyl-tRNA synthetase